MRKILLLLVLLIASNVGYAQMVYSSSLPEGLTGESVIDNTGTIVVTFPQKIRPNLTDDTNKTMTVDGKIVYSARGKFWSDDVFSIVSTIVKINPLDTTQLLITLADVPIVNLGDVVFTFTTGFVYRISPSTASNSFALGYVGGMATLLSNSPTHNQDNALPADSIVMNFSSTVATAFSATKKFYIKDNFGTVVFTGLGNNSQSPAFSMIATKFALPYSGLTSANGPYKVYYDAGFFKSGGVSLAAGVEGNWNFSTKEITYTSLSPVLAEVGSSIDGDLVMIFSEAITAGSGSIYIKKYSDGSTFQVIPIANAIVSGSQLSIPHNVLTPNVQYYVEMSKGIVTASASNTLFGGIVGKDLWNFTTGLANVWVGSAANYANFTHSSNWSGGSYTAGQSVVIGSAVYSPVISSDIELTDLIIQSRGSLIVGAGVTVTLTGKLSLESASLKNAALLLNGILVVDPAKVFVYQYVGDSSPTYKWRKGYSSPVASATATSSGMTWSTKPLIKFVSTTNTYVNVPSNEVWDVGRGYACYPLNRLAFTGALNADAQYSVSMDKTPVYAWNFLGNPYTASLNWPLVYADNAANVETPTCWVLQESGTWIVINGVSGQISGGTSTEADGPCIPRGHAFFVRATGASSTLLLKKTHLQNATVSYLKSAPVAPISMRFSGINDQLIDNILYGFHPDALSGFDAYDSQNSFFPNSSVDNLQLATYLTTGEFLAINNNPPLGAEANFNIAYYIRTSGSYAIELTNLDPSLKVATTAIFLTDTEEGITKKMVEGSRYYFYTNATSSPSKNRFQIKVDTNYSPATLVSGRESADIASAYFANKTIYLDVKNPEPISVEVCDMNGVVIMQTKLQGANKYSIPFAKSGFYLVRVTDKEFSQSLKILTK